MITFDLNTCPCQHDEYYRFLEWLPTQLPADAFILECGTWQGRGANCLGRLGHRVETYDPWPRPDMDRLLPNVTHYATNIFDLDGRKLREPSLIFLDIDPHAGPPETDFFNKLKAVGYRNLLVCDDISMNEGMKAFWNAVDLPKFGTGQRAHLTGMGLVCFSDDVTVIPQKE